MANNKNNILNLFGDRVRQARVEKKLSQEDLANLADLHRTYIGMVERAERNITLINMNKIAQALDLKLIDLLKNDT
ncbi:DNA-binding transcriptional regulator, XRE-family HTH domain [Fodinibius roseus]|uniref:DNA-binding transcriptional regulator, XRE-family HTH domain n=1 Tax=Fodinibius roseus TaxID=1194090 RepID=A0A1M5KGD6_9BACT|nr:helix-turn-helix transcriptional regulator [Fodinibius roseus]SHG51818.1 DNA-binding transcriptional regulator, XRE-family HTH domain [Fodinibius roseus]